MTALTLYWELFVVEYPIGVERWLLFNLLWIVLLANYSFDFLSARKESPSFAVKVTHLSCPIGVFVVKLASFSFIIVQNSILEKLCNL